MKSPLVGLAVVAMVFGASNVLAQDSNDSIESEKSLKLDYGCAVSQFNRDDRLDEKFTEQKFKVEFGKSDMEPVVSENGVFRVSWNASRIAGVFSIEVRNDRDEILSISEVRDGDPLRVIVPSAGMSLTCSVSSAAVEELALKPRFGSSHLEKLIQDFQPRRGIYMEMIQRRPRILIGERIKNSQYGLLIDFMNQSNAHQGEKPLEPTGRVKEILDKLQVEHPEAYEAYMKMIGR